MEMQELNGFDDEKAELSGKVFSIEKQKRFVEFQKDAKKYVIFVLALPVIGAIGLSIFLQNLMETFLAVILSYKSLF